MPKYPHDIELQYARIHEFFKWVRARSYTFFSSIGSTVQSLNDAKSTGEVLCHMAYNNWRHIMPFIVGPSQDSKKDKK